MFDDKAVTPNRKSHAIWLAEIRVSGSPTGNTESSANGFDIAGNIGRTMMLVNQTRWYYANESNEVVGPGL